MAHGGLADKEHFGGAGDTALRHQGVKGEQQVEVELVQFHQDYLPSLWDNPSYSFDGCERNFLHCDHCYFSRIPARRFGANWGLNPCKEPCDEHQDHEHHAGR
ncbi:hypothetical protein ACSZOO_23075 [Aeromonas hydrophila]